MVSNNHYYQWKFFFFLLKKQHFKSGIIRVKCTSTVIRMHTMSNEIILRTEIPMTSDKYLDNYLSETLSQIRK